MQQWKIGDVVITKVVEQEVPVPLNGLLHDCPPEVVARHPWLTPDFVDEEGNARLSIHALVVETPERRMVVDTCVGNGREGLALPTLQTDFLDRLTEIGPVDTVICTHLHFDHVGWNTMLVDGEWVPTFPEARYLFARPEWEHWQVTETAYSNVGDTVRPVVEAGLADLVDVDHQVCAEVRLTPTPGHTPGHVSVLVESGGERAVITGDLAHHPIQFAEPQLGMDADSDGALAADTRRAFLAAHAAAGTLVIGTHFGGPTAGYLREEGGTYRLDC